METTSLSLYPCKGTPFRTSVVILDATCPLLHFHDEWLNILWFVLITYYNNGWVWILTQCKWLLCNWPKLVPCFIKILNYICEHWRLFCRFHLPKIIDTDEYLLVIWKYSRGPFFNKHVVLDHQGGLLFLNTHFIYFHNAYGICNKSHESVVLCLIREGINTFKSYIMHLPFLISMKQWTYKINL